jgi:hypothetical protein
MVKRARRFARVLLALTIPVTTFAQNPSDIGGGPPPNLNSGAFQSTVELMWRASPTFRGQCACVGNRPVRAGESCRAIEIGRRVAKEVEESRHRPNQH